MAEQRRSAQDGGIFLTVHVAFIHDKLDLDFCVIGVELLSRNFLPVSRTNFFRDPSQSQTLELRRPRFKMLLLRL